MNFLFHGTDMQTLLEAVRGEFQNAMEIDGSTQEGLNWIRQLTSSLPNLALIISNADQLTTQCFNRLLRLMEEPPPNTTIALVTTRLDRFPVTIRSRCQERQF